MKAAKGQPVKDPDIHFTGPKATTRVFMRTDGCFAVTIDHGDRRSPRYETMRVETSLTQATTIARNLAGVT